MAGSYRTFLNETAFQHFVLDELNKVGFFFTKEALAIRGLPDVIGVANGFFVALELKKNKQEASRKTGRIVLQKYWLEKFQCHLGFARIACPETWDQTYKDILLHCKIG